MCVLIQSWSDFPFTVFEVNRVDLKLLLKYARAWSEFWLIWYTLSPALLSGIKLSDRLVQCLTSFATTMLLEILKTSWVSWSQAQIQSLSLPTKTEGQKLLTTTVGKNSCYEDSHHDTYANTQFDSFNNVE